MSNLASAASALPDAEFLRAFMLIVAGCSPDCSSSTERACPPTSALSVPKRLALDFRSKLGYAPPAHVVPGSIACRLQQQPFDRTALSKNQIVSPCVPFCTVSEGVKYKVKSSCRIEGPTESLFCSEMGSRQVCDLQLLVIPILSTPCLHLCHRKVVAGFAEADNPEAKSVCEFIQSGR